jgi:methylenetetrahydrofolate reductase (NADPH)
MPITNFSQLARFSDACGAEIPRWVRKRLEALGDDIEAIRAFGHEVVLNLCSRLLEGGAPGLHFYSMNQAQTVENGSPHWRSGATLNRFRTTATEEPYP